MSDVSQRYARLSSAFADKIAAVPSEKWGAPSPCPEWNALDVVRHVVSSQGMFLGFVGKQMPELPRVDDDPLAAWNAARAEIQKGLENPAVARAEFEGFMGTSTFEEAVNRFLCFDLVVHAWDLSRAAGLDDNIPDGDVDDVRKQADALGDVMRSPQAFGPALEPPPGAGAQEKLLAFLGREV